MQQDNREETILYKPGVIIPSMSLFSVFQSFFNGHIVVFLE